MIAKPRVSDTDVARYASTSGIGIVWSRAQLALDLMAARERIEQLEAWQRTSASAPPLPQKDCTCYACKVLRRRWRDEHERLNGAKRTTTTLSAPAQSDSETHPAREG